jgi:hypothetical protein
MSETEIAVLKEKIDTEIELREKLECQFDTLTKEIFSKLDAVKDLINLKNGLLIEIEAGQGRLLSEIHEIRISRQEFKKEILLDTQKQIEETLIRKLSEKKEHLFNVGFFRSILVTIVTTGILIFFGFLYMINFHVEKELILEKNKMETKVK